MNDDQLVIKPPSVYLTSLLTLNLWVTFLDHNISELDSHTGLK